MSVLVVAPSIMKIELLAERLNIKSPFIRMAHTSNVIECSNKYTELSVFCRPFLVQKIYIVKEFPLLNDSNFTVTWLSYLFTSFINDGQLIIELPINKGGTVSGKFTENSLKDLGRAMQYERKGNFIHIYSFPRLETLNGAFPYIVNQYNSLLSKALEDESDSGGAHFELKNSVQRFINFSIHSTWQNSFLVKKVYNAVTNLQAEQLSICDMGAGLGFTAMELSCVGNSVLGIEKNSNYVADISYNLAGSKEVSNSLEFINGDFECISNYENEFDIVLFVYSLLYAQNKEKVIESVSKALKENGVLMIRELPKDCSQESSLDHDKKFMLKNLVSLLEKYFCEITFYSPFTGNMISADRAANSIMFISAVPK